MEDRQIQVLIEQSDRCRRTGDWSSAIDFLRRALALDPDHARAHAALALALLGARRLHGAAIEAGTALALDGNEPFCHYAAAAVRRAERKLDDAWQHCLVALQADNADIDVFILAASIRRMQGQPDAARELIGQALAHQADNVWALTDLALLELDANQLDEAARRIESALTAEPENHHAHCVAGTIALRRGDAAKAEEHARFVLGKDATDHDALVLWTAIKMRRNVVWGLWWRFSAFVSGRSERGQVGLLIGSFVIARLAIILAGWAGWPRVEDLLSTAWLGFCAYTWVAPQVFRWMLDREFKSVVLRSDF